MRDTKTTPKKTSLVSTVLTAAAVAGTAALAYSKRDELGKMTKTAGNKLDPVLKSAGTMLAKTFVGASSGLQSLARKMDPSVSIAANDGLSLAEQMRNAA